MNCPYCDENIHPNSKFCPKCGLPLKEDSTVMGNSGAYVSDDGAWNPLVVGAGAVGIVVVALAIGWMTARKDNAPLETVRRQPAGTFGMPGQQPAGAQFGTAPAFFTAPMRSASVASPWTPNIPVKWAWEPSAHPMQQPLMIQRQDPMPPPQPIIAVNRVLTYEQPSVTIAHPTTPPIAIPPPPYVPPVQVVAMLPADTVDSDAAPALPTAGPVGANGERMWIWDPVQEQWARNADWRPSRRGAQNARLRAARETDFYGGAYAPGVAYPVPSAVPAGIPGGALDGVNNSGQ